MSCLASELLNVAACHKVAPKARKNCAAVLTFSGLWVPHFVGARVCSNMLNVLKSTSIKILSSVYYLLSATIVIWVNLRSISEYK